MLFLFLQGVTRGVIKNRGLHKIGIRIFKNHLSKVDAYKKMKFFEKISFLRNAGWVTGSLYTEREIKRPVIHTLTVELKGKYKMKVRVNRWFRFVTLCLILCGLGVSPAMAFGATGPSGTDPVTPPGPPDRTVMTISASFVKVSDVQALAQIYATSGSNNATILSSVELQSRSSEDDEFETELGPVYCRVWNSNHIEQSVSFPISSGKEYRIKVTITDTVAGVENSVTDYFDLVEDTTA